MNSNTANFLLFQKIRWVLKAGSAKSPDSRFCLYFSHVQTPLGSGFWARCSSLLLSGTDVKCCLWTGEKLPKGVMLCHISSQWAVRGISELLLWALQVRLWTDRVTCSIHNPLIISSDGQHCWLVGWKKKNQRMLQCMIGPFCLNGLSPQKTFYL